MSPILKTLIIEDETPAAEKLERYLKKYSPDITVAAVLTSVQDSVRWLQLHQAEIDLIFMDIQLYDGISFQIFRQVEVHKPVIFITAYNEFALDAFKVNSIDYLMKPITFMDLSQSLKKLESLRHQLNWKPDLVERVTNSLMDNPVKDHKSRFMVKVGDHIRSITADQISFFYAEGRDVYLVTNQVRKFIIDYTLEGLEEILDPRLFSRVNRTYILNIHAIQDMIVYSNSRLKVTLSIKWENEIIVSREKVADVKAWFDGNH